MREERHTGRTLVDSEGRDCSYVASSPGTLGMADHRSCRESPTPAPESEREGERERERAGLATP